MAWLNRQKAPLEKSPKTDTPDGMWQRCAECSEIVLRKDFVENHNVCPKCNHHFPLAPEERIARFLDPESFEEFDESLYSPDPLSFVDSKSYQERIEAMYQKTGRRDAFYCGRGLLFERPIQIGAFDFRFMGGSMGSVVGEKIARLFGRSLAQKEPAVIFSSSGGARMQEGILSLMQMAKTCAALAKLKTAGVPFISVLCHPTTGGVAASFAMLGDVNIGEPNALIGFAGPRVIQQTIGEELPEGFQRSEYLLEHGMLDMICDRENLRINIANLLRLLAPYSVRDESTGLDTEADKEAIGET